MHYALHLCNLRWPIHIDRLAFIHTHTIDKSKQIEHINAIIPVGIRKDSKLESAWLA